MQKNKIKFKEKNIENTVRISSAPLHQQINCKCVGANCIRPNFKGITLVALVITIIVMLLLIGVTISVALKGDLFNIAERASVETRASMVEEKVAEWKSNKKIDEYLEENSNTQSLEELLNDLETQQLITNEERKEIEENMQVSIGDKEILFYELPDGYTRCEYLESTGTQYINTKANWVSEGMHMYGKTMLVNGTISHNLTPSVRQDRKYFGLTVNNSSIYPYFRFLTGDRNVYDNENFVGTTEVLYSWDINFNTNLYLVASINGVEYAKTNSYSFSTNPMYLFARNTDLIAEAYAKCRVYNVTYELNNNTVFNFIPCLDQNGTPCMYDIVSKQPFYNQGSGEFLYAIAE